MNRILARCVPLVLMALLCFPAHGFCAGGKEKVLLDTDMVEMFDDGVALAMLAKDPKIELMGVTTVTGNSWVEEGTAWAARQIELLGEKIPVAAGASLPMRPGRHALFPKERELFGRGQDTWVGSFGHPAPASWQAFYKEHYGADPKFTLDRRHGSDFIIDAVRANPHEITIAAIGPCTNLALAIIKAPDIVPLVKRVVYMGGSFFKPGNVTPAAEFNWWADPEAAQIALRAPFAEQIIFGLDVCEKVIFTKDNYDRLLKVMGSGPQSDMLKKTFLGQSFSKDPHFSFFVWDVLVAAAIIDPSLITSEKLLPVDMNTQFGVSYGQSLAFEGQAPLGTQKARIILDVDKKRFWDMVCDGKYWTGKKN